MSATLDQFQGCLLGLSLGDALGAPYEGGFIERLLWKAIGTTRGGEMRWTDDTQMSIDVIESFLEKNRIDQDNLALHFARNYRWSRGYGPGTARILKRIAGGADWRETNRSVYPTGSFGNGAAMRAPIVGLIFANRTNELLEAARLTGTITHAHALGIEGAVLLACATEGAVRGLPSSEIILNGAAHCTLEPFTSRLATAQSWLATGNRVMVADLIQQLGNGIAAQDSCVTAVYVALRFRDQSFLEMQHFAAAIGGDVDTIGAMSGALWGAANGAASLPAELVAELEQNKRLISLATALHHEVSRQFIEGG